MHSVCVCYNGSECKDRMSWEGERERERERERDTLAVNRQFSCGQKMAKLFLAKLHNHRTEKCRPEFKA